MNKARFCKPIDIHYEGGTGCSCVPEVFDLPDDMGTPKFENAAKAWREFEWKPRNGNYSSAYYVKK